MGAGQVLLQNIFDWVFLLSQKILIHFIFTYGQFGPKGKDGAVI
jgi:hypothetical protein